MDDNRTFAELAVVAGYELSNDVSSALQPEEHEAVRVVDPHCMGRDETDLNYTTGAVSNPAPQEEERLDFFVKKDGVEFAGTHLLIDLSGAANLNDLETVEAALREAAIVSGATILNVDLHHFEPNGGISGVVVLSESHISIHTWPERDFAALDIFMCGDCNPYLAIPVLKKAFKPSAVQLSEHRRGLQL
ncbi:MAG TPA: adenosylmethionine decarboxylase [Alphaproteobacteria bacterium]|nr:adenosylmethionine decarboxylase [Alphaproteobacteria bacterium]